MRDTLAIALILLLAAVPALRLYPLPPPAPAEQPAVWNSTLSWAHRGRWFGGLSGLDTSADGSQFYAVTDRGHVLRGDIRRNKGKLAGVTVTDHQPLRDRFGEARDFPDTDAEDVALATDGTFYVSFEHAHRVLQYANWEAPAVWPSYTRTWRALGRNKGLEALAVTADGTLFTISEGVASGATEALVYRRKQGGAWQLPFTVPLTEYFKPVGADFGPDGLFYLLERDFRYGGFRTQVRRFRLEDTGFSEAQTVLRTNIFRHGNLEGLSVWRDAKGKIRFTMVSDNNFKFFMRSELVEYVLTDKG